MVQDCHQTTKSGIGKLNPVSPGTKNYQVCPAIIDGEQYLFVDTAGFGAADIDDMANFHDIITCLDALSPFVTVAGVLFVYGGNQDRMMKADLTTIQWVKCFCGPEFYKNITIVTSKWDSLSEDDFEEHWESKLPGLLNDPSITEVLEPSPVGPRRYHGGAVYHHSIKQANGNDTGEPIQRLSVRKRSGERAEEIRAMISKRYKEVPNVKLQVVREMACKTPWYETEAAKVLEQNPLYIRLDVKSDLARVSVLETPRKMEGAQLDQPEPISNSPLPPAALEDNNTQNTPKQSTQGRRHKHPWFQPFFQWLDVAKEAAAFFMTGRQIDQPNTGKNGAEEKSMSWVNSWGTLSSWWSGPPKTS